MWTCTSCRRLGEQGAYRRDRAPCAARSKPTTSNSAHLRQTHHGTARQTGKRQRHNPSDALAVFAITGRTGIVESEVRNLADFLHMLGNPVGVISSSDSQSLERFLNLEYPLSAIDVQQCHGGVRRAGAAAPVITSRWMKRPCVRTRCNRSASDVLACDKSSRLSVPVLRNSSQNSDARSANRPASRNEPRVKPAWRKRGSIRPDGQPFAVYHRHGAGLKRGKANIKSALRVSRD